MHFELIKDEPALLLSNEKQRILIVADLHIGYERTLFKNEQASLNVTERIIQKFEKLVADVQPSQLIILGDLKHTLCKFSPSEFQKISQLLYRLQKQTSITIIRGNHDADLELVVPDRVEIIPSSGLKISLGNQKIYLLHGHALPSVEIIDCDSLIMGHIHPTLEITSLQTRKTTHRVWVKTRWKSSTIDVIKKWFGKEVAKDEQETAKRLLNMRILIIPAFLDLLRGHILNQKTINESFGTPLFQHLELEDSEIVMLDHTYLGKLGHLWQPDT